MCSTFTWPAPIVSLDDVTSTMDEAAKRAPTAQHLTCIVANSQSSGRGRRGRTWVTLPHHSIAFTLILKENVPQLPLLAALGVAKALEEMDITAQIKWPNDVLINGLKVAGILIEKQADSWLLGIGINTTMPPQGLPKNMRCTTLQAATSHHIDNKIVLQNVLNHVKGTLEMEWKRQVDDYISRCSTLGQNVRWHVSANKVIEGIAERLDKKGTLYINTGTEIFNVESGEIIHE